MSLYCNEDDLDDDSNNNIKEKPMFLWVLVTYTLSCALFISTLRWEEKAFR